MRMQEDAIKTQENGEVAGDREGTSTTCSKSRLEKTLPTGRVIFAKQLEILKAYPAAHERVKGPVSIEDLKDLVSLAPATISQANPFFNDVGIIQKEGRKFMPSPELESMLRLSGISPDKAWAKLAPLIEKSWFGRLLIPKLRIRPMSEDDIIHDLADAARADADHRPQLRMIIDYLMLVGLIAKEGGLYRLVNHVAPAYEEPKDSARDAEKPPGAVNQDYSQEGLEQHSLTLDPRSKKRIVLFAPPNVTKRELERIQNWLSFQLIVDDPDSPSRPE